MAALAEGIPDGLLSARSDVPRRLREDRAFSEEAPQWAVESWALAPGVISLAAIDHPGRGRTPAQDRKKAARPQPIEPIARNPSRSTSPVSDPAYVTKLSPYTLEPGVAVSSIQGLPAACD